jgi:hypothetical protein
MDDGGALVVGDHADLERLAAGGGPMNMVTAGSSVWKARQWCRSAWSMSSSRTPCLRALGSMSTHQGYEALEGSSTSVDDTSARIVGS